MRRRLVISFVTVVAVALLVAGLGSQLLVRAAALEDARRDVAAQAQTVATSTEDLRRPAAVAFLRDTLRLEGAAIVRFAPDGQPLTDIPRGLRARDLRIADLTQGRVVSGTRGNLVYGVAPIAAASPSIARPAVTAVVLTRHLDAVRRATLFFLLSAVVALVLAAIVGARLARRIAHPLDVVDAATKRIASGDLKAVVRLPHAADPEVESLARSITAMAEHLDRSRSAERQFLMSVSHDLRTPLTAIRGYGEALAEGAIDDTARAGDVIVSESKRLERLVGDLLDLSRIDARRFSLEPVEIDVVDAVSATTEAFQPAAASAGVTLRGPLEEDASALVLVDPDRLAQVVANLIENALSYAASEVDVTASHTPDGAQITVSDDGPGIDEADLAHVFEPHFRSDRSGRRLGTGLGLAIVAELVAAMGGTVQVLSPKPAHERGTRMTVRLPREGAVLSDES